MVLRLLAVSWERASFKKETGTLEIRCDKMNRTNPRVRNAAGHSMSTKTCFTLIVSCVMVLTFALRHHTNGLHYDLTHEAH